MAADTVGMDLTNAQWARIEPLIPVKPRRADGKGRPSVSRRQALNGVLWVLQTGARWKDLPFRYPPFQTVHRWFLKWNREGVI
ncbi:MAG: transposase, partial [Planctomycetes bacterium]|nr:transposase [Planctomycetota bacterium]